MIAIAVSLAFALYVVGPDAFSRLVLGFTVPRRSVVLSRSEEISRALVWAVVSVGVGYLWAKLDGSYSKLWASAALKAWFSGVYSEEYFRNNRDLWFASLGSVVRLNRCLLLRTYSVVLLLSVALSVMTHFYGVIRDRLPRWTWVRKVFAAVVLPRVAQWHVLLSKLLLGNRSLSIHLDILTKGDKLYQGEFADKSLSANGSLISITLAQPRRFDREGYVLAKRADSAIKSETYWKEIPTNMFLVMASEMQTMNIRYLPRGRSVRPLKAGSMDLTELLEEIAGQVKMAQKQAAMEVTFQSQPTDEV